MPVFELEGKKYNVDDQYLEDFSKEFPNATSVFERNNKRYRVKASDYDTFMRDPIFSDSTTGTAETESSGDSYLKDLGEGFMQGVGSLGKTVLSPLKKAAGYINESDLGKAINDRFELEGGQFGEWYESAGKMEKEYAKRSDRYGGKDFARLLKEGRYGDALGEVFLSATKSAPTSLGVMAASALGSPAAGLAALGAGTASEKYDQLGEENPDMGSGAKMVNSLFTGLFEAGTEYLGAGAAGTAIRQLLKSAGREAAGDAIKKSLMQKSADFMKKHYIVGPIAEEAMEETVNALGEYITDELTGVERKDNIVETMLKSGVYGAAGGAQYSPIIAGARLIGDKMSKNNANNEVPTADGEINVSENDPDLGINTPPQFTRSRFAEAEQEGRNMTDPGYIRMANQKMEETRASLSEMVPGLDGTIESYVDDGASEAQVMSLLDGVNADARPLAEDFYADYLRISGLQDRVGEEIDNEVEAYVANNITPYITTAPDVRQVVTTATLDEGNEERPVYVSRIEGDNAVIYDNGQKRMVSVKRLGDIVEQDAGQLEDEYGRRLLESRQSELDMAMNHNPKTQSPKPGLVVWNGDSAFILQGQDENGDWIAMPAALDKETGQVVPKAGSAPVMPIMDRDILDLQDRMYDAQQAKEQVITQPEGDNMSENKAENATAPSSEQSNISENDAPDTSMVGRSLTEDEAGRLVIDMERNAENAEDIELTPENWVGQFGEEGKVQTPIGEVKMGDNQYIKLSQRGRNGKLGMIRPTLTNPDVIVEDVRQAKDGNDERESSYVFVKAFKNKDGKRIYYFTSVTVRKGGKEVVISNQEKSVNRISKLLGSGKISWVKKNNSPHPITQIEEPVPLSDSNGPTENGIRPALLGIDSPVDSDSKDKPDDGEKQAEVVKSSIIMKEDGTPDFVSSGSDMTLDFLHDKYGEKMPRKIEVTRKAFDDSLKKASDALDKAQEAYDDAPIGKEDKAEAALRKARQEYDAIKSEADFWGALDDGIKEANRRPGDVIAKEISVMGDPLSGEELAAMMLANGSIKLTRDSYKKETGAGNNETSRMFGLFASPEKGGVNIERAGEILELADRENGTNFFDENDTNAGRDAIIEVLSSARTRGDLIDYVKRNREAIAERERRDFSEKQLTEEERGGLDSQIEDEIQAIIDEQNEIDAILAQNKPIYNENVEGNDESGGDGLREGGGEVLPGEQLDQAGRAGETETGEQAGTGIDRTDGAAQEGASGEVRPIGKGAFGNIYDQFKGKFKEAITFLKRIKEGEAIAAIHHKDIGDISIVWGNKKAGLEKILRKHPEVVDNLQEIIDGMEIVQQSDNRIKLESKTHFAVISKEFQGEPRSNWLLTAYEKRDASDGSMDIDSEPVGKQNGTAPLQDISIRKDNVSSSENQANEDKSFVAPSPKANEDPLDYAERIVEAKRLHDAEREVDVTPTEAQKEAGNYRKGHVRINGFDVTIEQPAGSIRSGKDANGKEWSVTMRNTYGYIRGTEGVDGDHIDVFIGPDMGSDMVYVVDQVNTDGSFDEHKVMMGFPSLEDARSAYLSNYEEGWQGLGNITGVTLDEFKKWIDSSTRKTKPFSEYRSVKAIEEKTNNAKPKMPLTEDEYAEQRSKEIMGDNPGMDDIDVYNQALDEYPSYIRKMVDNGSMRDLYLKGSVGERIKLGKIMNAAGFELSEISKGLREESIMESDFKVGDKVTIRFYDGLYHTGEISKMSKDGKVTISADGKNYTVSQDRILSDSGIRFREVKDKNGEKSLVGLHNISEEKLRKALRQGGFANPSAAVIDISRQSHTGYGAISLVLPSSMIEKRTGKNAGTWSQDAWTPTYPTIERQFSGKGSDAFSNDLHKLPEEMQPTTKSGMDSYMDGRGEESLAYMYLYEQGKAPEIARTKPSYPEKTRTEVEDVTNGSFSMRDLSDEQLSRLKDAYMEYKGFSKEGYKEAIKLRRAKLEEAIGKMNPKSILYEKRKMDLERIDKYGFDYSAVESFMKSVRDDISNSDKVDARGTMRDSWNFIEENGMRGDFNKWLDKLNERYGIKEIIFNGFTPSGIRKYIPNTLENVSKFMKKQGRSASVGIGASFQNFAASLLDAKGSLKDIRKDKGKLTTDHADVDAFRDKWSKVFHELGEKLQPDAKGYDDYGLYRLAEAARSKDPQKYIKEEYGIDFSDEDVKTLNEMVDAIRNEYPAMYFETKFERPVYLEEFAAAVVPDNVDGDISKAIYDAGLKIFTYKADDEISRNEAVKQASEIDGVRFRPIGEKGATNLNKAETIESSINDWSNKLNTPVRVIHDVDDITDTDENMLARKRDSKGWYDTSTGEIVIVSPNSTSVGDAQRTFLHEVVGHHGLRELFGDDFDTFLDNVYRNANEDIRKNIIDRTKGNPLNLREATEEYLAELAERGFDNKAERSLWEKIKDAFIDMLRKAGISLDFKLSDNDLRYILWRSYKNLNERDIMDVAEDIVMRRKFGVDNANSYKDGSNERDIEPEKGKQPSETKGSGRELVASEDNTVGGEPDGNVGVEKPGGAEKAADGYGETPDGQAGRVGKEPVGEDMGGVLEGVRAGIEHIEPGGTGRGVGESPVVRGGLEEAKRMDNAFAEKKRRIEKLRESDLVEITGEEIKPDDDLRQYKKNAIEYGKSLQGEYVNKDTGRKIQLQRGRKNGGLKEVLQHDTTRDADQIKSVAAIPQIIEKSVYIDSELNQDPKKNPDVSMYHYYVCGMKMGNEDYTVRMVEAEDLNGNRYYDHKLTKIEKGKLLDELSPKSSSPTALSSTAGIEADSPDRPTDGGETIKAPVSGIKDRKLLSILQANDKENADKIFDATGWSKDADGNWVKDDYTRMAESTIRFREAARDESVLYAGNDIQVVEKQVGSAKDQYERTLRTSWYQFQEAVQDSMLGLKELMDSIAKATKSRILDYENAYMAENALSSVNEAEFNAYRKAAFEPILKAMSALERKGSGHDEIIDYLMTRHGIERNREMAVKRALSKNEETYKSMLDEYIGRRNAIRENGDSWEEQQSEMDGLAEEYGADLSEDFSGLTGMYPNEDNTGYDPDAVKRAVSDYESRYDTSGLSESVKRATDAILAKQRDSGLMSQKTFEAISDMYQFYVPLRGWEETTADEVYAYLTSESQTFNAPIKKVSGRKSKADDPIATIANMAESGIMQGNRNLMKQKFLTMVQNHKTDLVSVSDMWVRLDEASGEWIAVFPDIPSNATPDQVENIVDSFNRRMEELSNEKGSNVRRSRDSVDVPYKILPKDLREHQVIVKRAGREYVLTINGNPRAAQALNGLTNPDRATGGWGILEKYTGWLNRNLSANFTTRNPNFMASNFIRDALYSNTSVWVKESPAYALAFNRNFAIVNPINMFRLVKRYEEGTLDMSNPIHKAYREFVMRGGETGYTNLRDVEDNKKAIKKELQYANQKVSIGKAIKVLGYWMDLFNKSVENCARFAAFITSKGFGRSTDRSIYDAKEISVNFNKKGSGGKFIGAEGQTAVGNMASIVSWGGRNFYVFWNAGVQGMYNFGRLAKNNPKKFLGLASSFYLLGTIIPMIAAAFDEDDEDDYYDLPEYVRRSNICFRNGGGNWITVPLPIELRAIYGLGEMMTGVITKKESYTDRKLAMKVAEQMSQVLPLDMLEGGGGFSAFVPSSVKPIYEAGVNKDWTGLPLYKDNDFNKGMPEWTKAFKSVDPSILAMTKYANELTGGDKYTTGVVNMNPAVIEHILDGYFGGIEATRAQMVKSAETMFGKRDFDWRNIPVASRVIKSGDERTKRKAIDNAYYDNLEEMEKITQRLRGYEKELENPKNDDFEIAKYQKLLNDLEDSEEFERYEAFMDLNSDIKSMREDFQESGDEVLEQEMYDLKAMMNEIARGK